MRQHDTHAAVAIAPVRSNAARALARLGPEAKAAVPALSEALKDEEAFVRGYAASALSGIGPAAVPALSKALKDEERDVRVSAAAALARLGPAEAKAAVPALSEALKDEVANVRRAAARALDQIRSDTNAASQSR